MIGGEVLHLVANLYDDVDCVVDGDGDEDDDFVVGDDAEGEVVVVDQSVVLGDVRVGLV